MHAQFSAMHNHWLKCDMSCFGCAASTGVTLEVETVSKESYRQMFDYSKADVEGIKSKLLTVDWQKLFCDTDAEQNWLTFKEIIEYLQMKYMTIKQEMQANLDDK